MQGEPKGLVVMGTVRKLFAITVVLGVASGCANQVQESPEGEEVGARSESLHGDAGRGEGALDFIIRGLAFGNGHRPHPTLERDLTPAQEQIVDQRAELGSFLFYDKALSGVKHTTCGTCHHADFQYADGRNIARGVFCDMNADGTQTFCQDPPAPEDGDVVGPDRTAPLNFRNSPSVINSALFPRQMLNGRFHFVDDSSTDVRELDASLGFQVQPFEEILHTRSLLGGQAFKPVPDPFEMAGDFPDIGQPFQPDRGPRVHEGIAARIDAIDEYREMFEEAYAPGTQIFPRDPVVQPGEPLVYQDIADAIAQFQEDRLVLTDSPWDDYLAGDDEALSPAAKRGALVFFTRGNCASCHAGPMLSDFEDYNIAVPQVGPGTEQSDFDDPRYQGFTTYDFGAEELLSGTRGDRFEFRTPPLRGVTLTAPYMHNGAYRNLEDAILHHVNPWASCLTYDATGQVEQDMLDREGVKPCLPMFDHRNPVDIGWGTDRRVRITRNDVPDLVAFLQSLTDPRMLDLDAPDSVPSGLSVDVPGPHRFPVYTD